MDQAGDFGGINIEVGGDEEKLLRFTLVGADDFGFRFGQFQTGIFVRHAGFRLGGLAQRPSAEDAGNTGGDGQFHPIFLERHGDRPAPDEKPPDGFGIGGHGENRPARRSFSENRRATHHIHAEFLLKDIRRDRVAEFQLGDHLVDRWVFRAGVKREALQLGHKRRRGGGQRILVESQVFRECGRFRRTVNLVAGGQ